MARTYVDSRGYRRFSDSGELVSRWVASKKVGGNLYENQVVHHKNRNKLDNRSSNLWVFNDQKKHHRTHRRDKKRTGYW